MIRRLFRLVFIAGIAAGAVAVVRAMTRTKDPLPAPADAPTGGPWPPLRNETSPETSEPPVPKAAVPPPTTAPPAPAAAPKAVAPKKSATRKAAPSKPVTKRTTMAPEPGGVPVADDDASAARAPGPATAAAAWVEPTADGECPDGHPIKAKMSSKIFHSPGQLNYDRTTPDRCYVDTDAAAADGLRAAKR